MTHFLIEQGKKKNFAVNEICRADAISERFLADYDLVIQLDFPPYTWPEYSEAAFIRYIEEGGGAWIGFHHATLLGEFDGYPLWHWFSNFMGGITFKNYYCCPIKVDRRKKIRLGYRFDGGRVCFFDFQAPLSRKARARAGHRMPCRE